MAWINHVDVEAAREAINRHQQLVRAVWRSGSGLTEAQRHMVFLLVSSLNGCHH